MKAVVAEAIRRLESGRAAGRVVLTVRDQRRPG
jgi:hypothetical protein